MNIEKETLLKEHIEIRKKISSLEESLRNVSDKIKKIEEQESLDMIKKYVIPGSNYVMFPRDFGYHTTLMCIVSIKNIDDKKNTVSFVSNDYRFDDGEYRCISITKTTCKNNFINYIDTDSDNMYNIKDKTIVEKLILDMATLAVNRENINNYKELVGEVAAKE